MPYKYKTSFFGIPVVGPGDKILSTEEIKKAHIIENQLIASTRGQLCCVYEDGEYSWVRESNGTYTVRCSTMGEKGALTAIVNGGLAQTFSTIKWEGIGKNTTNYLYIGWTDTLYEDEESFSVFSSKILLPKNNKKLLLAYFESTESSPFLTASPDSKLYAKDISGHIGDNTDPHGEELIQDWLKIRKEQVFEVSDDNITGGLIKLKDTRIGNNPLLESSGEFKLKDIRSIIQLSDGDNDELLIGESLVGAINSLYSRSPKIIQGVFAGSEGVNLEVSGAIEIHSIIVSALEVPEGGIGDIYYGYFNQDTSVTIANQVKVYNTGSLGGKFRATIWCK